MAEFRTLKLSILADVDNLKKQLGQGEKEVQTFGNKVAEFGKKAAVAFAAAAAAAGAYAVKLAVDGVKGLCLKTVRQAWQIPAKYPSAISAWNNTPKKNKFTDPMKAPIGATHFWKGVEKGWGWTWGG